MTNRQSFDNAASTSQQSQGSSTVDQAKQKASQAVGQAEQKASQLTDQAKQQATSQLASQKQRATDTLGGVAQALRQTGQHLREQDQGTIAQYTDKAAQQLDSFSGSLRDKNINQLLSDTERFARREPTLFLGGAFLVGLLGARFLKSSSQPDQSSSGSAPSMGRRPSSQTSASPYTATPTVERRTVTETSAYGTTTGARTLRGTEER